MDESDPAEGQLWIQLSQGSEWSSGVQPRRRGCGWPLKLQPWSQGWGLLHPTVNSLLWDLGPA